MGEADESQAIDVMNEPQVIPPPADIPIPDFNPPLREYPVETNPDQDEEPV